MIPLTSKFFMRCLAVAFLIFGTIGCEDESDRAKLSGEITTTDDHGDIRNLKDIPVEIHLYKSYPTAFREVGEIKTVYTDKSGEYKLLVDPELYKAYYVRVADEYYRKCTGSTEPLELQNPVQINYYGKNSRDISVCLTSRYKIELHKASGSTNKVAMAYIATFNQIEPIGPEPDSGAELTEDTYVNFFSAVSEVRFKFFRKDSMGASAGVNTISSVPVPGTTEVIVIDY